MYCSSKDSYKCSYNCKYKGSSHLNITSVEVEVEVVLSFGWGSANSVVPIWVSAFYPDSGDLFIFVSELFNNPILPILLSLYSKDHNSKHHKLFP